MQKNDKNVASICKILNMEDRRTHFHVSNFITNFTQTCTEQTHLCVVCHMTWCRLTFGKSSASEVYSCLFGLRVIKSKYLSWIL